MEEEENDALEDISNRLKRDANIIIITTTINTILGTWLLPSLSILDVSTGMTSSSLSLTHGHCAHARIIPQLARANISVCTSIIILMLFHIIFLLLLHYL